MATAKKTPAKKTVAKKVTKPKAEPTYVTPMEVKNWIEQAHSTINHLRGEVERLKTENKELKAWRRWAEGRILNASYE